MRKIAQPCVSFHLLRRATTLAVSGPQRSLRPWHALGTGLTPTEGSLQGESLCTVPTLIVDHMDEVYGPCGRETPLRDPRARTRAEIDAETEQLKAWMRAQRETTDGHTWTVQQRGLMIRNGKLTYADRQVGYAPVAHHPVWGDEVRQAYWCERQAGIETGPPLPVEVDERWRTMERWAEEQCAARCPGSGRGVCHAHAR